MNIVGVNGHVELIDGTRDIFDLIEKYMGSDMRFTSEEIIDNIVKKDADSIELAMKERDGYEADLESNQRAFMDIIDEIEHLEKMERFSKKAVLEAIRNIHTIINNQI